MKIGIQGGVGSTNERAAYAFAKKQGWKDWKIEYLFTSENVLHHLSKGKIDMGIYAWESTIVGKVEESVIATKKYPHEVVDSLNLELDHALLRKEKINEKEKVQIYSHPQALLVHRPFLEVHFRACQLISEKDTALAAERLLLGEYPQNSLVLAPIGCAEIYGLDIYFESMPQNEGYITTFNLVKKE